MSNRNICIALLVSISIKCLLCPSYRSTDFDVHRNWKSIVSQLPLNKWYFENTCEWTLDYPPFFAYFEYILSRCAQILMPDTDMLRIEKSHQAADSTVQFMRASVVFSDMVLVYAIWNYCYIRKCSRTATALSIILVVLNGGLLLIDHVHFQYNGMLMGVLILCCSCAYTRNYIAMAVLFCLLVLSKHLFAPFALIFAAYLIKKYCIFSGPVNAPGSVVAVSGSFSVRKFLQLLNIALCALLLAFGPFIWSQFKDDLSGFGHDRRNSYLSLLYGAATIQLRQMGTRLFPFGRGLLHAYPAANIWVLYYALDRLVLVIGRRFGLSFEAQELSFTSGIVTDIAPNVFPKVTAVHCLSLVVVALTPVLYNIAGGTQKQISPDFFVKGLLFCSLTTFMLGYHVHEKAILICVVLCSLLVCRNLSTRSDQCSPTKGVATNHPVDSTVKSKDANDLADIKEKEKNSEKEATEAKVLLTTQAHEASVSLLLLRLCLIGPYTLFPLFVSSPAVVFPKVLIYLCFVLFVWIFSYEQHHHRISQTQQWLTFLFVVSIVGHFISAELLYPYLFADSYPFLPLLSLSCIGAVQLLVCWVHSFIVLMDELHLHI